MADVDNGDVLRIGASWLLSDAYEVANVFHVRVTAGGGLGYSDASDDVGEYMEDIYNEIRTHLTDEMDNYLITLQNITQVTTIGAFSWPTPLAGIATQEHTATGVSCLTWGRTLKPRVQIRKYWGIFTEAMMEDGLWVATLRTACAAALNLHLSSFVGTNGLTMLGVAYNRTLGTTTDAISVSASPEPAYQRRRRRGRGS